MWLQKEEGIEPEPLPKEWGGIIPTHVFVEEAKKIVMACSKDDIPIRLIGGLAVRLHCPGFEELATKLGRLEETGTVQEFTDLDFLTLNKARKKLPDALDNIGGYIKCKPTLSMALTNRDIFYEPHGWWFLDVFYEVLRFNHDIKIDKRTIVIDDLTLSATDLFFSKVQIVKMTWKDLKDLILLLRVHEVAYGKEKDKINSKRIAKRCADEWGFYYTCTENLKGIKALLPNIDALSEEDVEIIANRIDTLLNLLEKEGKGGSKWQFRAKIGTKRKWYRPVETKETMGMLSIWSMWRVFKEEKKKL